MFCRSENFCPQLGVSNSTHGTVYTNNSPTGVLTTGGQTPQTSSLSGSIDSHKMIYITFGAELVGCISCHILSSLILFNSFEIKISDD